MLTLRSFDTSSPLIGEGKGVGEVVQLKVGADEKHLQVTPGDHFIKLCQDELEALMGPADSSLDLDGKPACIMMIGLQGAGKTTTTGKLAKKLINDGKKPLLVAADIYRPAAVEQLKVLGARLDTPVFHLPETTPPRSVHKRYAKQSVTGTM